MIIKFANMKVGELKQVLREKGIKFNSKSKKAELQQLVLDVLFVEDDKEEVEEVATEVKEEVKPQATDKEIIEFLENEIEEQCSELAELTNKVASYKHLLNRIGRTCSPKKINAYYKQLAKLIHPDKIGGDGKAMQLLTQFKEDITSVDLINNGF